LSLKADVSSLRESAACNGWQQNSDFLRCEQTNTMDYTEGVPEKSTTMVQPVVGGAIAWGVWPTTVQVLNYLPTALTAEGGKGPGNFLVDPVGTQNAEKIPTGSSAPSYPSGVGQMQIGGYRSNTKTSEWVRKYVADPATAYAGMEINFNVKMAPGDQLIPSQTPAPTQDTPSPSPTPVDPNTWCSVSASPTQNATCLVTVSGGMHKVVTFHILPWNSSGGNPSPSPSASSSQGW